MTTPSSDVAEDEQFFFTQTDGEDKTEEPTLQRKEPSRKKATEWLENEENPQKLTDTLPYSMNVIKAEAWIRMEQDVDLILKILKLKIFGQPDYELRLTTDRRFEHYKADEDRIILKDGLLFRKKTTETLVMSKATKFSFPIIQLIKYSGTRAENLDSTSG